MKNKKSSNAIRNTVLIAVPFLFVIIVGIGLIRIFFRDIPESARAPAIEQRFAAQLAALEDLARNVGMLVPGELPDPEDPEGLHFILERHRKLEERIDGHGEVFSDPAVLGASIWEHGEGHIRVSITIKEFDEPPGMWRLPTSSAVQAAFGPEEITAEEKAAASEVSVRYFYSLRTEQTLVKYKRVFRDDRDRLIGFELIMDMASLESP
jgi:hypothetical protein